MLFLICSILLFSWCYMSTFQRTYLRIWNFQRTYLRIRNYRLACTEDNHFLVIIFTGIMVSR